MIGDLGLRRPLNKITSLLHIILKKIYFNLESLHPILKNNNNKTNNAYPNSDNPP